MKKHLFFILFIAISFLKLSAQPILYGVTQFGGSYNGGTLFQFDATTYDFQVKKDFNIPANAAVFKGKLLLASNHKLYGIGAAELFEFDPATGVYAKKADFVDSITGSFSIGNLIQLPNGKIIGTCVVGGLYGYGTIFEFDITSSTITKLYDFDISVTGGYPQSGVASASNGKLYGTTNYGGLYNFGTLWEFDPQTNSLIVKYNFDNTTGAYPFGYLKSGTNGKLYGVCSGGGTTNQGTLFEYDISTYVLTKRLDFDGTNGASPLAGLNQASNGLFYGTTVQGGQYAYGTLYSFDPVSGTISILHNFNYDTDGITNNSVIQASNGKLYGLVSTGANNFGSIYEYNINSSTYSTVFNFDNTITGGFPFQSELIEVSIANPCANFIASSSATTILCNGDTSTITISASGGTAPYSGIGSFTRTAGTYSFVVTDANGCTANTTVVLTEPTLLTASASAGAIICNGDSTTITVSASGGTTPYAGTGNFTATAGTHSYTVTDANGCMANISVTLTEPIAFMSTNSCINNNTLIGNEKWFSFVADIATRKIVLRKNPISLGHINTMQLHTGPTCSVLSLINYTSIDSIQDNVLELPEYNLIVGKTYYIRVLRDNPTCLMCQNGDVVFDVCLSALNDDDIYCDLGQVSQPLPATQCELLCNGNFESNSHCPSTISQMSVAYCWNKFEYDPMYDPGTYLCWTPNGGTPDYFNSNFCPPAVYAYSINVPSNWAGTENSHSAGTSAYAGIFTYDKENITNSNWVNPADPGYNFREYIQQKLSLPMIVGKKYRFTMYLSLSDSSAVATYVGVLFSNTDIHEGSATYINRIPQIETPNIITQKNGWTQLTFDFVADSAYQWVVIGNFRSDLNPIIVVAPSLFITAVQPNFPVKKMKISYYYIDDVSIIPIDNLTTTPSNTICNNSSVTIQTALTVPQTATYFWSSLPNDPSLSGQVMNSVITVTPHQTTSYYIVATDKYGCKYYDTTIVTVSPIPSTPIITGSNNICSSNSQNYCVPASYQTYSWSVIPNTAYSGSITGANTNCATITWNPSGVPTTGATVTVTVTNAYGCSATSSMNVYNTCPGNPSALTFCNTSASNVWLNKSFYNSTSAGIVVTGTASNIIINTHFDCNSHNVLAINGTFIIDVPNFSIKSSNIVLSPNSQIIIQASRTLTIEQSTWLHACSTTMWDGIYVSAGAKLVMNKNCLTEDAKNAVVSIGGGKYQIASSIFNKNYKDIVVQAFAGAHQGTITNSIFTCRGLQMCQYPPNPIPTILSLMPTSTNTALASLPSSTLLLPYSLQITRTGVEITDVNTITVDLPTGVNAPTDHNVFDNMDIGIKSTNSTLKVKDNWFQYIIQPSPVTQTIPGCCVGTPFTSPTCAGSPACSPPPPPVKGVAIWAIGNSNISFIRSLLVGTSPTSNYAGDINNFNYCTTGILAETNIHVTVVNNKMNNFVQKQFTVSTGVLVQNCIKRNISVSKNNFKNFFTGIQCKNITWGDVLVKNNSLSLATASNRRGIVLQNIQPFCIFGTCSNNPQEVAANNITNVRTGILIMQSRNIKVTVNSVSYNPSVSGSLFGIRVQGSPNTTIDNNTVSRSGPNPSLSLVNSALGISLETGSGGSKITNNQLIKMGTGIRCLGSAPSSTLACNFMNKCYNGVGLYGATIGTQGSSTNPSDNKWVSQGNLRVFSNLSGQILIPWWYRTGTSFSIIPFSPTAITPNLVLGNPPSTCSSSCNNPPCHQAGLAPVVNNLVQFTSLVNENKWMAKKFAFAQIKQDTAMLNAGTTNDAAFQNFYASTQSTTVGVIVQINDLIAQRDLQNAQALNDAVSPANLIESNWQETNRIYINKLQNNDFTLDTLARTTLWDIAPQNPMIGGEGVYLARVLLDVNYDDLDASRSIWLDNDENIDSAQSVEVNTFKLYPNPNDGNMIFEYTIPNTETGQLILFDITGRMIAKYTLNNNSGKLAISEAALKNGVYFYSVIVNGETKANSKFVIIK